MSGMSVEMLLKLVDQFTGPLRAAEAELKDFGRQVNDASASSGGKAPATAWVEQQREIAKATEEVRKFDKAATDLGKGVGTGGKVRAAEWVQQQREIEKATEELQKYDDRARQVESASRAAVDAAVAHGLSRGSMALLREGAKAGIGGAHSEVSLETQGNSVEEIRAIQERAGELSRQFRAFDRTTIERMIGAAKSAMGSLEHGFEAMPDTLRLRMIQQGEHGHTSDEDFNTIYQALEIGGSTRSPEAMHDRMETFAKIMNAFKETIRPEDFRAFYAQAGVGARVLSDEFMRGAGSHLMQEMGGASAGNAVAMFHQAIEAGTMQPKAMETMDKLGLLDPEKVRRKQNGEIRWVDPGGVKGWSQALSDPDKWVDEVLRPALEKLPAEQRDQAELAMFSNQSVRKLVDKVLNQKSVIDKDHALVQGAPGLGASETWLQKDPAMAAHEAGAQFENMMRDAGSAPAKIAMPLLNWLSEIEAALGRLSQEHPAGATVAVLTTAAAGFWGALKAAQAGMQKAADLWSKAGGKSGAGSALPEASAAIPEVATWAQRVGSALKGGLLAGIAGAAVDYGVNKAEERFLGWTPESNAKARAAIEGKAHAFWRGHGIEMPWWEKEQPAASAAGGGASAGAAAAPKVDTGEIDQAKAKAEEAGPQIKAALDVTAKPTVDTSSIEAAIGAADSLIAKLERAKAAARGAATEINRSAGSGLGSLHDGTETH